MGPAKRCQARRFPNLGLNFCLRVKCLQPKKVSSTQFHPSPGLTARWSEPPPLVLFDNRRLTPLARARALLPAASRSSGDTSLTFAEMGKEKGRAAADRACRCVTPVIQDSGLSHSEWFERSALAQGRFRAITYNLCLASAHRSYNCKTTCSGVVEDSVCLGREQRSFHFSHSPVGEQPACPSPILRKRNGRNGCKPFVAPAPERIPACCFPHFSL